MSEQSQTSEQQQKTEENQAQPNQTSDENALGTEQNSTEVGKPASDDNGTGSDDKAAAAAASDDSLGTGAADEDKGSKADEASGGNVVPENYSDFDLPQGVEISAEYKGKMEPVFKSLGLSQAQAQQVISAQVAHVQESEGKRADQMTKLHTDWLNDARADKDIGGDKFDVNLKSANAAVNQLGTAELKTMLKSTGIGNHPEVIRIFAKIGGLLAEDNSGAQRQGVTTQKGNILTDMYPDDPPQEKAAA